MVLTSTLEYRMENAGGVLVSGTQYDNENRFSQAFSTDVLLQPSDAVWVEVFSSVACSTNSYKNGHWFTGQLVVRQ